MQHYALTFPQLVTQALVLNLDDKAIVRLHAGYDLAERMADGLYRSQGCPFINHLVRTSSIVLAHGGTVAESMAAMLHSAYMLNCFHRSRRRAFQPGDREILSRAVGEEVEAIVWEYYRQPWGKQQAMVIHRQNLASYGPATRSSLYVRLANELEDYLDQAMLYRPNYNYQQRIGAIGEQCIELAIHLGAPVLGQELREAFAATLSSRLPEIVVRQHINAYEHPRRHYNEQNIAEFVSSSARKLFRKLRR